MHRGHYSIVRIMNRLFDCYDEKFSHSLSRFRNTYLEVAILRLPFEFLRLTGCQASNFSASQLSGRLRLPSSCTAEKITSKTNSWNSRYDRYRRGGRSYAFSSTQ